SRTCPSARIPLRAPSRPPAAEPRAGLSALPHSVAYVTLRTVIRPKRLYPLDRMSQWPSKVTAACRGPVGAFTPRPGSAPKSLLYSAPGFAGDFEKRDVT